MKNRVWIIAIAIIVLAALSPVPRANAEPLTIMAVVGVATVLTASMVDVVTNHYDDNRDQRAQQDETDKMHAKAETTEKALSSEKSEVATRPN